MESGDGDESHVDHADDGEKGMGGSQLSEEIREFVEMVGSRYQPDMFPGGPTVTVTSASNDRQTIDIGIHLAANYSGESNTAETVLDLGLQFAPSDFPEQLRAYLEHQRKFTLPCSHVNLDTVRAEAWAKMIKTIHDSEDSDPPKYLPQDAFETIFDLRTVLCLLQEIAARANAEESLPSFVERVMGADGICSRRRILAILVLMDKPDLILDLVHDDVWDEHLPFRGNSEGDGFVGKDGRSACARWDPNWRELFSSYQPKILVPYFHIQDGKLFSYELSKKAILPWTVCESKSRGGSATVYQVQIHPSHHNYKSMQGTGDAPSFALKHIRSVDQEAYRRELRALEKAGTFRTEKHLVKLLLTFRRGPECFFLFEWASGNLQEFWKTTKPRPSPEQAKWLVTQCLGIATAIKRLHGLSTWHKKMRQFLGPQAREMKVWGTHGDIKPRNILWFEQYRCEDLDLKDHLVVSDLGLTRFHSDFSKSLVPDPKGFTFAYSAPEMETDSARISRKYDVWSLGCVFLEFCVWYHLQGYRSVRGFLINRGASRSSMGFSGVDHFYHIPTRDDGRKIAEVKPCIQKWVDDIRAGETCTSATEDLLSLIMEDMLQVDLEVRKPIDEVCSRLAEMLRAMERGEATEPLVKFAEGGPAALTQSRRASAVSLSDIEEMDDTHHPPPTFQRDSTDITKLSTDTHGREQVSNGVTPLTTQEDDNESSNSTERGGEMMVPGARKHASNATGPPATALKSVEDDGLPKTPQAPPPSSAPTHPTAPHDSEKQAVEDSNDANISQRDEDEGGAPGQVEVEAALELQQPARRPWSLVGHALRGGLRGLKQNWRDARAGWRPSRAQRV